MVSASAKLVAGVCGLFLSAMMKNPALGAMMFIASLFLLLHVAWEL